MSYTPTNWKAGDTVTSAKLNKMEQGIANNILIVGITMDEETEKKVMNKTWQEIFDADYAICMEYADTGKSYVSIVGIGVDGGEFRVIVSDGYGNILYSTQSADGHPITSNQPK